jgi:hypothetical protein
MMKSALVSCLLVALSYEGVDSFAVVRGSTSSTRAGLPKSLSSLAAFEQGAEILQGFTSSPVTDGLDGVDPLYIAGAVGIAALAFLVKGGASDGETTRAANESATPEPEAIDVSIPYDATAMLAYNAMCAVDDKEFDEAKFSAFKKAYYELAVAEVVMKQKSRNLASLLN